MRIFKSKLTRTLIACTTAIALGGVAGGAFATPPEIDFLQNNPSQDSPICNELKDGKAILFQLIGPRCPGCDEFAGGYFESSKYQPGAAGTWTENDWNNASYRSVMPTWDLFLEKEIDWAYNAQTAPSGIINYGFGVHSKDLEYIYATQQITTSLCGSDQDDRNDGSGSVGPTVWHVGILDTHPGADQSKLWGTAPMEP